MTKPPPSKVEKMKTIRVKVSMVLELDAEQWATEYGLDVRDVREDVKSYVCHWAEQTPVPMKLVSSNIKSATV